MGTQGSSLTPRTPCPMCHWMLHTNTIHFEMGKIPLQWFVAT